MGCLGCSLSLRISVDCDLLYCRHASSTMECIWIHVFIPVSAPRGDISPGKDHGSGCHRTRPSTFFTHISATMAGRPRRWYLRSIVCSRVLGAFHGTIIHPRTTAVDACCRRECLRSPFFSG